MPLPVPSPTDRELLNGIRQRREEALENLYDRYAGIVYALCLRILDDERDAEEELIEVYRELWENPDRSAGDESNVLSALLHRARCRSVARLRRLGERTLAVRRRRGHGGNASASKAEPASGQDQPVAARLAAMRFESRMALGALPAAHRAALEVSFYDGLFVKQIARRLNTTTATVRQRIHAGMRRLRNTSFGGDGPRSETWSLM